MGGNPSVGVWGLYSGPTSGWSGPICWVHVVWMVWSGWASWVYAESTPMLSIGVE
jgi:hypothetical protein